MNLEFGLLVSEDLLCFKKSKNGLTPALIPTFSPRRRSGDPCVSIHGGGRYCRWALVNSNALYRDPLHAGEGRVRATFG